VPPTGTDIVNDAMYSGGQALKVMDNTGVSTKRVTLTESADVVLMARGGQTGGSPTLELVVDGVATGVKQTITNSGSPVAYRFDLKGVVEDHSVPSQGLQEGKHIIGVKGGNIATGRNAFVDVIKFPG
jgi:hypothetical protein